jgi:hypothetical protein
MLPLGIPRFRRYYGVTRKRAWRKTGSYLDPKRTLLLILLVGLIHGIIYVFAIPPWWHYDEAGHLEYSWLLANRPGWPKEGFYDEAMHRLVAESMLRTGFYKTQNYTHDLTSSEHVWIGGTSQVGDPPHLLPAYLPASTVAEPCKC